VNPISEKERKEEPEEECRGEREREEVMAKSYHGGA